MSRGKVYKIKVQGPCLSNFDPIFNVRCHDWSSVLELKQSLHKILDVQPSRLQLFYKNLELNIDNKTLNGYDIKTNDIICVKLLPQIENSLGIIHQYTSFEHHSPLVQQMIDSIKKGFKDNRKPKLSDNGTSGCYMLDNSFGQTVAIFKPFDQEPFAPNNPKGYVGQLDSQGLRKGIMSGESATRQVATFILDQIGFHGVPETTYVEFYHPSFQERKLNETAPVKGSPSIKSKQKQKKTKHGSLQRFIQHDDTIGNYGGNCFSVQQIHKIAILDIRILNCDRNDENILVKKSQISVQTSNGKKIKKQYNLTPIDHGLSFPDSFEIYDYQLIWINFPQCLQPFSEKELQFIENINPQKDCQLLKQKLNFRPICLRNFRIAQILLKESAKLGLNLYEISQIMYRTEPNSDQDEDSNNEKNFSQLEKIVKEAQNIYSIVKKSGLKRTIEYQIGLIKPLDLQLVHKPRSDLVQIKQQKYQSEQQSQNEDNKSVSGFHLQYQTQNKRSVSLPTLKHLSLQDTKPCQKQIKKQKQRMKQRSVRNKSKQKHNEDQVWSQIFFYYFQQMLKRFLKNKQSKQVKRGRYMSQNL